MSNRPTSMKVDGIVYWTIMTYDADGVLVDADSTPTVAVRKNGASVADAVTVTKRSATTGIYDCSHSPAGEAEGDTFIYEESATVSAQAYLNSWSLEVLSSDVNVAQISGDGVSSDNLRDMFNGVGYIDPNGPSYQSQLSNIAVTGAAINTTYTSQNVVSGGVVSGNADNTIARDGVHYQLNDTAGLLDVQFDFEIGSDGIPTGITLYGYLNGGNDSVQIQAYDWVTLQFRTLGTIQGSNGTSPQEYNFALFTSMVGSGVDDGTVRIRLYDATLTNSDLYIDQLYTSYSVVNRSIGYSNGSIWVNGLTGTSGTVPFIDGTADNPVDSYANAISLNSSLNLRRFTFSPGDVATLTQNMGAIEFLGTNYIVNLNSQVPPTVITGAEVTGASTSTVTHYMRECRVGTNLTPVTLNSGAVFDLCGLVNIALKDQAGAALDIELLDCHGNTQESMFPGGTIDFGVSAGTNHEVSFQRWGGPVTLKNLKDGDTVYFHGNGTAIFDPSCTGGSFRVAGMINIVDNAGGAVSVLEDGRITISRIADAVWDENLPDHLTAGSTGEALNAAGAAGDPWTTTLPGTYTGSQAGKVLADVLEDTGTTLPTAIDNIDTIVDLIKVDTTAILVDTGTTIPAQITALNDISVDDIYDEPKSNQIATGSFGQLLNNVFTFTTESYDAAQKLNGMMEPTGVGGYQFTALGLENAPVADVSGLSTFDHTTDQVVASNMRGTDGANTVTPNTIAPDNASISAINTNVANTEAVVDLIKSDTTALISDVSNLNDATAAEVADAVWDEALSGHINGGSAGLYLLDAGIVSVKMDPMIEADGVGGYQFTATGLENAPVADVSGLSTFDASTDQVVASNMRGTDGANTIAPNTVAPDNASIAAILADTNELQLNQNNWLTATTTVASNMRGTDNALLAANVPVRFTDLIIGDGADLGKVTTSNPAAGSGSSHTAQDVANLILAGDQSPIVTSSGAVSNVVLTATTTDLTNQSAGGDSAADIYAYFTSGTNENVFKADVSNLALSSEVQANGVLISGLNDFDPVNDVVAHVTLVDTTTDLTNGGGASGPSSADIYGYFTAGNNADAFKAVGFNTVVPDNTSIAAILSDTNDLQSNQGQWLTASGFATPADVTAGTSSVTAAISGLNDFDPALDTVARVTLVDTTTDLTNGGGGGGDCPTAQEIVDTWGNQPQGSYTTPDTLGYYLDAQVSNAGSGGTGLYQATVRVQDNTASALQGARVNIDGTTLTLTTNSSGEVTFNLDSGVYLIEVSPPAGYDTPTGQTLTVNTSDPSDTVFTLSQTTPPTGCEIGWL